MVVSLQHHYGWKKYSFSKAKSKKRAAYLAVRKSHKFLTDDNHTYKVRVNIPLEWGGKTSYFNSVKIYAIGEQPFFGPAWAKTDYWFAVQFK